MACVSQYFSSVCVCVRGPLVTAVGLIEYLKLPEQSVAPSAGELARSMLAGSLCSHVGGRLSFETGASANFHNRRYAEKHRSDSGRV